MSQGQGAAVVLGQADTRQLALWSTLWVHPTSVPSVVGLRLGLGERFEGWEEARSVQTLGSGGLSRAAGRPGPGFGSAFGGIVASAAGNPDGLGGSEAAGQGLVLQHEGAY